MVGGADWHKATNVSLVEGRYGLGYIQGGPFAEDVIAHVTSKYGLREVVNTPNGQTGAFHTGLDLVPETGDFTPVYCTGDGAISRVERAEDNPIEGNWIEVDHGNGARTVYRHLASPLPTWVIGMRVLRGDVLGLCDNTGRSTGYHLHYEVLYDGVNVDPLFWMLAAPDIGQVVLPTLPEVGSPSPELHWTKVYAIAHELRNGTVIIPWEVFEVSGSEIYYSIKDNSYHNIPTGTRKACYLLQVPLEELP